MTLDFEQRRDVLMAFATPIAQIKVSAAAEINPGLRRTILEREASSPGQARSNVGGWHSADDFLTWPVPEVAELNRAIELAVQHMSAIATQSRRVEIAQTLRGWANVCRAGGYHVLHNHATYHWSGVYYVAAGTQVPEQARSGVIEMQDPRGFTEMSGTPGNPFGRTLAVTPVDGILLVFPSWLYHWVNPYEGEGERISIAFNARVTSFKVLEKAG